MNFVFLEAAPSLPSFPTVDFSGTVNWFVTGVTGMVTSNAGLVVGASLAIAGVFMAIRKIKQFGKSAIK